MNAPYDGDREQHRGGESPPDPYAANPYVPDPYAQGTHAQGPYTPDPYTPDPYTPDPYAPDARGRDTDGPYGDDPATFRFTGVDELLSRPRGEDGRPRTTPSAPGAPSAAPGTPAAGDPFAHLYRDQGQTHGRPGGTPYDPPQDPRYAPHPQAAQPPQHGPPPQQGGHPPYPPQQRPPGGPPPAVPEHGAEPPAAEYPAPPDAPPDAPEAVGPTEPTEPTGPTEPAPARRGGGKAAGLLRSSAIMAAGTMVSRLTGFIRSALVVVALGATTLGDSYQLAITLPTMLYILTVGGGLNSVFVPQLVRAMKNDEDGGEAYANRLLTLVAVILGALAVLAVLAAPLLVRMMSVKIADSPQANDVAVTFVRYCLPSIFFMGIHVVMGQVLNARGRFGAMMWTPVLNNVVIIFTVGLFLGVYGTAATSGMDVGEIPPEGVRLLGAGTLLGLVVQALAMIPYLRAAGFRIRPRFDWRGHGLGKAARLAKWTILFVLANQAGVLVVSQLSTWAGDVAADGGHPGTGFIAYSNAQLIWTMPHAIITVSVMAALLPRLSRSAHDGDTGAVRDDISQGLRNSAVAIVPIAFGLLALGIPMCLFIYGSAGTADARSMGYMLMAFGLGLVPYSVQYVVLRAFYAYEDTRTPFYNTVIVAAVNAAASGLCFLLLPARWAVVGMAASYGLAYAIGVGVAWRRLRRKLGGDLDGAHVVRTYARLAGASLPAALAAGGAAWALLRALGNGYLGSTAALLAGGLVLSGVFVLAAKRMRIAEMTAMLGMVRARLGR